MDTKVIFILPCNVPILGCDSDPLIDIPAAMTFRTIDRMPGEIFFLGQTLNRSVVPEGIKGLNPRRISVFDCLRSMNDFSIEIRSRL
jgi:hypothetical protein